MRGASRLPSACHPFPLRGRGPLAGSARRRTSLPHRANPHLRRQDSREIAYAITSLSPEQADPDDLLALCRDHWHIENRLHWRRDVILQEDRSRIRSGAAPRAMAALRNTPLDIVRDAADPLTEIRETFAENRLNALAVARRGIP